MKRDRTNTVHRGDSEKRDFLRMGVDCKVTVRLAGSGEVHEGTCRNLSGNGMMFVADQDFPVGTRLEVSVIPEKALTAPLDTVIEVVRSQPLADGGYEIAGEIQS
jgi:hypothetical protein